MPKGNNKFAIMLLSFILAGIVGERTYTWNALAQLDEKKVGVSQYEKDREAWQKRLDEAVSRIEKANLSAEAREIELRKTMDKLLLELRDRIR